MFKPHAFRAVVVYPDVYNSIWSEVPDIASVFLSLDGANFLDAAGSTTREEMSNEELRRVINGSLELSHRIYYRSLMPQFKLDSVLVRPDALKSLDASFNKHFSQLWISTAGCVTPLHYDKCHGLLLQLHGYKRFIIYPPDEARFLYLGSPRHTSSLRDLNAFHGVPYPESWELAAPMMSEEERAWKLKLYPKLRHCTRIIVDLSPGDALYTPPGWLHEVSSVTHSISITVPWDMSATDLAAWPSTHEL